MLSFCVFQSRPTCRHASGCNPCEGRSSTDAMAFAVIAGILVYRPGYRKGIFPWTCNAEADADNGRSPEGPARRQQGRDPVPDRTSQLMLNALSRAAAEPAGVLLHPARGVPGLFPSSAAGRQAALRCTAEGYLCPAVAAVPAPVPANLVAEPSTSRPAKMSAERYVLTDKGLSFLLGQTSPRPILEDFVRALESRHAQASGLLMAARQMLMELTALRSVAERVLERVREPGYVWSSEPEEPDSSTPEWEPLLLGLLDRRQEIAGSGEDCPLPELFRLARAADPSLTAGRFHDALRRLNDDGSIYLHPWTGPLYDLPEPTYALLVGHVVAYYASRRNGESATGNRE
jgi:hypothetical protein